MKRTIPLLSLVLLLSAELVVLAQTPQRKPHPFAPSLPLLTDEEEEKLDRIIDRFIQFDLGKLGGEEGQRALKDFKNLGPEAFFALVRGINRAAAIEGSCPAATIAKELGGIIRSSNDTALLDFARENIGAGAGKVPHMGILKDLRVAAMIRRRDAAQGVASSATPDPLEGKIVIRPRTGDRTIGGASTLEVARLADSEKGAKRKEALNELARRGGETAINALGKAAGDDDSEIRYLAQDLLVKTLIGQQDAALTARLKDRNPEVRAAAARVVGEKMLKLGEELIALLNDKEEDVRQAARSALTRFAPEGTDFGPDRNAKEAERQEAMRQWRAWWAKQK